MGIANTLGKDGRGEVSPGGGVRDGVKRLEPWLPWVRKELHRLVVGCGAVVVLIGLAGLAGWVMGIEWLKGWWPGQVSLKANAALGLVGLGLALLVVELRVGSAVWRRVGAGLAGSVGLVALVTLTEYGAGVEGGIDQWWFRDGGAVFTSHPGRMSPLTALGLLMGAAGCGVLSLGKRGRGWLVVPGVLGVVTLAVSLVSLSGYLAGVPTTFGWGEVTRVSIPASVGLAVLGGGVAGGALMAATWDGRTVPGWVAVMFFVGGFTGAVVASVALAELRREQMNEGVRVAGGVVARGIGEGIWSEVRVLERMLERGEVGRGNGDMEARVYLEGARRRLGWWGQDGQMVFEWGRTGVVVRASGGWGGGVTWTNLAKLAAPMVAVTGGGRSFVVAVPGRAGGGVVGELGLEEFVSGVAQGRLTGVNFRLKEGQRMLFEEAAEGGRGIWRWRHEAVMRKPGAEWRVESWPTAAAIAAGRSALPAVTLGVGLVLSVLLGLAVHLLVKTRQQHFELLAAHERLEAEGEVRRVAELAVQRQKEQVQGILDNCTACIYMKDLEGRYLLINRQFERLFHVRMAEVLGKNDFDLYPAAVAAAVRENDVKVAAAGVPIEMEEMVPQDDGPHTYVSVKFPMRDGGGKIYAVCGISTDITERKLGEERLRMSHQALQLANDRVNGVIEGTHDLVAALDLEYRFIAFNSGYREEFRKIFGREIALGMSLLEALAHLPGEQERAKAIWGRALRGEEFQDCQEFGDEARERNYYELTYSSIRGAEGRLIGAAHFVRDVSRRRRAELQLAENEARLALALKSSRAGTWHWNMVTGRITWDDEIHAVFGVAPGTFRGTYESFAERLVAEDRERVAREVRMAVDEGAEFDTEYRCQWPDGTQHWIAARGRVYRNAEGKPSSMVGVCWDVTRRKEAENELKELTKALARSNKDLQQFAYVASHDLQEPLRMVTSFLQLLSQRYKGQLDAEADEFIGFAVDGARRMHVLIRDLLTYSRVDTQAKALEWMETREAYEAAVANLRVAIGESGATVTCGELPRVRGDFVQWVQLLQNLIGNGLKFRGVEAPVVRVEAERVEEGWRFAVRDNGIGIDPQFHRRLFVIFQRLHSRQEYPGNGIGLAVCCRIVERHGGRIWVESESGKGSVFYFTIPAEVGGVRGRGTEAGV